MRWLCLALGFLAACSGSVAVTGDAKRMDGAPGDAGPDPNDGARSGSRLKITYWAFADGTRAWNEFYDAQRKENCYLGGPFSDGNYYCTPTSNTSLAWSNATCTTKVAMVYNDPTCPQPPPTYALDYDSNACTFTYTHLYLRGAKTTATSYYYQNSDGTCGGPYTATGYDFYALGTEIPLSALVQLNIGAASGTGTLSERFVTSSDGLSFPWTVHDSSLNTDCYAVGYDTTGASAVCIPNPSGYAGYDHDAACTQPELSIAANCATPRYAEYFPQTSCPSDPPTYYNVGSQVAGSPLYYASGTQCIATTSDPSQVYYTTGSQLTLQTMARAPDTLAGHRIQLIHDTTSTGLRFRDYSLYDQQLGAECYPITTPDGATRCLTIGTNIDTYYKDTGCTQAIDLATVYAGPSSCGAPTVPKYGSKFITPPAGSCGYSYEIHPVGAPYTATVYTGSPGACSAYSPSASETRLYNIGATMDPSSFDAASLVTDQ